MAQDIFVSEVTDDLFLENGTTLRFCASEQELTRQRLQITLATFQGEWFANIDFGVPYFESIFGKETLATTDAVFKATIRGVEGLIKIIEYDVRG